jgi:hypothetical protein
MSKPLEESLFKRLRKRRERDIETEKKLNVTRNVSQSWSRADVEQMTEEMVPWYARDRRRARDG